MAKSMEINYTKRDEQTGESISGTAVMNMPETIEEAVQMWGEDVCLSKLLSAVVINAQAICRAADSPEAAQEAINSFVPGVSRQRAGGPSQKAIVNAIKNISKERLAQLLKEAGIEV